jgi:putative flippase GtrA
MTGMGLRTPRSDGPGVPSLRPSLLDRVMTSGPVRRVFRFPAVQRALLPARGDRAVHKFIRYSMVSGVAIAISSVTILVCAGLLHLSGILSNTIGALAATPASYELNRKWAWGKHGKSHLWKEVVPFWVLTVVGFLASTGTVAIADSVCNSHHIKGIQRGLIIDAASLFAYGVVWVVKFVVFNTLVFAGPSGRSFAPQGADGDGALEPALSGAGRQPGPDVGTGSSGEPLTVLEAQRPRY